MKHIAICVPCVDKPHLIFVHSFGLLQYEAGRKGIPLASIFCGGSIITNTRNNCMRELERIESEGHEFSHVFWLDADMAFPQHTLVRLLSHEKDVVGCTYARRTPPYDCHGKTLEGRPQDVSKAGLLEVAGLPTGCLLVRRGVFRKLKKPYFRLIDKEESVIGAGDHVAFGEDYYFSACVRQIGFKLFLDTEWSKQIGHVSEKVLYPDQMTWPQTPSEAESVEGLQEQLLSIQKRLFEKKAA